MKFQIASSILALSSVVSATVMHVVTVGKDGQLAFCPDSITAESGDLVQFQFYPKVASSTKPFINIFRITPSLRVSLLKVAHPFQRLLLAPQNKVPIVYPRLY
jgi:hypothetical protein